MSIALFGRTQRASQTPFDNSLNGFSAQDAQAAIEEARETAPGTKARLAALCGYNSNASAGRWLEFSSGIGSNVSPFVLAENTSIKSCSVSVDGNSNVTFGIYKNGLLLSNRVVQISLVSASIGFLSGLEIPLLSGDRIAVKVDSGTASRVLFTTFINTEDT